MVALYALLALVANALVIGLVGLAVSARRSPAARASLDGLRSSLGSGRRCPPEGR